MTALDAAYEDLLARCHAADRGGDWQEYAVLAQLASVADYVRRVGDVTDSTHYRADKGGELLDAAIRLQHPIFAAHANWPGGRADDRITGAVKMLGDVAVAVRRVLWEQAEAELYDERPSLDDVTREVRTAAAELTAWADRVGRGGW